MSDSQYKAAMFIAIDLFLMCFAFMVVFLIFSPFSKLSALLGWLIGVPTGMSFALIVLLLARRGKLKPHWPFNTAFWKNDG